MQTTINRLRKNDVPKFQKLIRLFADVFEDTDNFSVNKPNGDYLETFFSRSRPHRLGCE